MKTDTIFYRLFQSFPSIFFELINQPPETANTYQFSSVEVKQLAFRIDGVFLPKSNPSSPIYFVEVQFQPDKKLYSRLFTEISLYLDKTQLTNNWRGVVVYPNRNIDVGETDRYIELLTSGRVTRIYLDELDSPASPSIAIGTVKLVIERFGKRSQKSQGVNRFSQTTNKFGNNPTGISRINRNHHRLQISPKKSRGDRENVWI